MPKGVTYTQSQYDLAEAIADALENSSGIPVVEGDAQSDILEQIRDRLSANGADIIFEVLLQILNELQGKTEPANTQQISVASLPLPASAATSDNQTAGNNSLESIKNKLPNSLTVSNNRLLTDTKRTFTQFAAETQLNATGATSSLDVTGLPHITCQYVVANIGTNVIVRLEGSNDGTSWFNLDSSDTDITKTSNGTYSIIPPVPISLYRVRFKLVSISGGNPTVDVRFTACA